jgi:transporter family-2 protein
VQALTVFSVLVAAGAAGAALFSSLAVTGGTVAAVLLDQYGLLGFAQRDATLARIGGRALLVVGTVLVARG